MENTLSVRRNVQMYQSHSVDARRSRAPWPQRDSLGETPIVPINSSMPIPIVNTTL